MQKGILLTSPTGPRGAQPRQVIGLNQIANVRQRNLICSVLCTHTGLTALDGCFDELPKVRDPAGNCK